MKKKELLQLDAILNSDKVRNVKDYPMFSYIVKLNKDLIAVQVEALREITKEFDESRDKLYMEYCQKDENNNPIVKDGRISIPTDSIKILNDKLTKLIEDHKKEIETFKKVSEDEIDIEFTKIDINELKGIGFTSNEIEMLFPILKM